MRILNLYHIESRYMFYNLDKKKLIKDQAAKDFAEKYFKEGVDIGFLKFEDGIKINGTTYYGPMREVNC